MRRREIIFALLLAAVFLLAAGFFFFSSSFFLTRVLVPWISQAAGCPVSVERAEFRPMSRRLILYGFRLGREDTPFLTVQRVRGTAQFGNLVRGIIDFADVELAGAELNICRDASGEWCRNELGLPPESADEPEEESSGRRPLQVRLSRSRVEDAKVNVVIRDRQRDISWSFTHLSGEVDDFRNGGAMMIKCFSPFQVTGREGNSFSGKVEWNGELLLDEKLKFSGMRGGFVFGSIAGNIDQRSIGGSEIRCSLDLVRGADRTWDFRNFRLVQQTQQQVSSLVEFSGAVPVDDGKYQLDFRRFMLSGQLLSLLMDMGCGVRPGMMLVDGAGKLAGDRDSFTAELKCRVDRDAGPAYFGTEKVDLPDFHLKTEQNVHMDLRSGKTEFRNAQIQVSSGNRQVMSVRKEPGSGTVKAVLDGFDLKILQFLVPDTQQFGIAGGMLSGEVLMQGGQAADSFSCRSDLRVAGLGFSTGFWRPELFDAVISGQFVVPRSGSGILVDSLRVEAAHGSTRFLDFSASGTIPWHESKADLRWKASGELDHILPMLRLPAAADAAKVAGWFSPVQLNASGKLSFFQGGAMVQESRLQLQGREQSSLSLELEDRAVKWSCADQQAWKIRWRTAFAAPQLPAMQWGAFANGRYTGHGALNVLGGGSGFTIEGEAGWQDLAGTLYGKTFSQLSGGTDFSFLRNSKGVFNLNRSSFYCRVAGKPALRLESSGSGEPGTGMFHADLHVRYMNEHLLNIILPGRFRTGQLSGRSQIRGDFRKQKWTLNGYFAVDKLRSPGAVRPVDGKLQYEFIRDGAACKIPSCKLLLNSGGNVLADLRMTVEAPADAKAPVKIQLTGSPMDLSSLYEQIGAQVPAQSVVNSAAPQKRMVLEAGARAKEVHLDLQNMSWGSSQCFALRGDLFFQKNRFLAQKLIIDGGQGQMVWNLDGADFPSGMMLAVNGKVLKPVSLGPFAALFFPQSGLTGIVESGEWNLNFCQLFSAHWGNDLAGNCKLTFRDVDLPVNAANGPLSRLLLLPVETIVRAEQLIPSTWDVRKHFETLWKYKFSAESPFSRLKFQSGDLQVTVGNGDLQVTQMQFTGEPLSKMNVSGKMRLVAPFELDFNSQVLFCGVQAKLPVRGVLQAPQVAAWQVFANLPGSAISGWLDVFTPFNGESKGDTIPFISPFMRLLRDFAGFQE